MKQLKVGIENGTKLLMIHADDAGLSHSHNLATIQLLERGTINSYSMMVPCAWFYEMAEYALANPQYDYGIHLTLTCEWKNYKFSPVLPVSEVPTLVDENGFFFRKRDQLKDRANIEEIRGELEAQINRALNLGLRPTHLDSHMYSVGSDNRIFQVYKALEEKYSIPVLINTELLSMVGLDPAIAVNEDDFTIDKVHFGDFEQFKNGRLKDYYDHLLNNLGEGINLLQIHPAFDDSEMQGITVDHPNFGSKWRQIDFDFFHELEKATFAKKGIDLITWKEIKGLSNKKMGGLTLV
ncbi:polysaccharide deacetylase family protein [Flexithrix dorotheae]|uniref:polysaccharide deacetylase family protein n=1 Tax=Flexithrix dorotheae TaxID=70993 RepID=UPI00035D9FB7|nr:polysaccharide deacetylase family protein [Flexithrix dorotheae]